VNGLADFAGFTVDNIVVTTTIVKRK